MECRNSSITHPIILDSPIQTSIDTEETANGTAQELQGHQEVLHNIGQHVFIIRFLSFSVISLLFFRTLILMGIYIKVLVFYEECK